MGAGDQEGLRGLAVVLLEQLKAKIGIMDVSKGTGVDCVDVKVFEGPGFVPDVKGSEGVMDVSNGKHV